MAGGDYRSCDVCGCKTYYDADLQYDFGTYPRWGLRLGDWKVICIECAKTHECVIVPRAAIQPSASPPEFRVTEKYITDSPSTTQVAGDGVKWLGCVYGEDDDWRIYAVPIRTADNSSARAQPAAGGLQSPASEGADT